MTKRAGVYRSDKRKKELMRQKKQEMKRKKRFGKSDATSAESHEVMSVNSETIEKSES